MLAFLLVLVVPVSGFPLRQDLLLSFNLTTSGREGVRVAVDNVQGESLDDADEPIVDVWRKGEVELDNLARVRFVVCWLCGDCRRVPVPRVRMFEVTWNGDRNYKVSNLIENGEDFLAE